MQPIKYPELQGLSEKEYTKQYNRLYAEQHPLYHLRHRGEWTVEEYRQRWEEQDGKCAICGQSETSVLKGKVRALAADHDHATGEPRGLLCFRCNSTLGKFEERLDLFQSATDYLKKWGKE